MDASPSLGIEALPPRRNLSRDIYERIEWAIVSGKLPPGMKLADDAFAELYGVSRSPIREAIAELQKVGFAEKGPARDRRVTMPTEAFITDCFDVWVLLESERVYEASLNCTASGHARIDELIDRLAQLHGQPGPQYDAALMVFHSAMKADCANRQLQRISEDWHKYVQWLHNLYFAGSLDNFPDTLQEHRDMVALFKARDRDGLLQLMRRHIRWQRDHILAGFRRIADKDTETADPPLTAAALRRLMEPGMPVRS